MGEAAALLLCLGIAVYYQSTDAAALAVGCAVTALAGIILVRRKVDYQDVGYREGFVVAALGWFLTALFGSVPFVVSGAIPHPVDAFFETMSGFTTTGASILTDIEALPPGLLFWRSLTHWIGGIGTVVLLVALIPSLRIAGMQFYRAEVSGPTKAKALPRVAQTSRQLFKVYMVFTLLQIVALRAAGMTWFDSLIHTFGTVATGGFSNRNLSVGAYDSLAVELIIVFFMVICGMSFALHIKALQGNPAVIWKDSETRVYLLVMLAAVAVISHNLVSTAGYSVETSVRHSLFQVSSVMTSTGFATADFDQWPDLSRLVLLLLMFVGACAGSTGGGIKIIRIMILAKLALRQLQKLIHPQAVIPIRVGRSVIPAEVADGVQAFLVLYLGLFSGAVLVMGALGLDLVSAFASVVATMSNIGPGLGLVGPAANYAAVPVAGKLVLSFCMLVGRLELFTVLALLNPGFWRK
ncbi:TrkH family potassium uptake protein [Candidatus Desulforudis audaxviator]|uniref:Cation transporter n=1 Tax=Desulforudis audaxviator (strain MP104C) TaxID=477974 RepID=B1I1A7_DESAP|nr:TrkH family potassium uptake protein [Candidatus Desulforudis audaxviator]ACA58826.1 cation transporter [Candidatus Desulforudis audaxviator MP104C]AZK58839.1 Potassium uptake protein TrkH [Candidatus Desulforudis audaxviator]